MRIENQRIVIIHTLSWTQVQDNNMYIIWPNNAEIGLSPTFQVILANTGDPQASHLASKLSETGAKVVLNIAVQTNNLPIKQLLVRVFHGAFSFTGDPHSWPC